MTRATGIDVSAHNAGSIAGALVGQSFAFVRATYGTWADPAYAAHAREVRAAGLVLGAYHFLTAAGSAAAQATAFLAAAAPEPDLYVLDFEQEPGQPPITPALGRAFIDELHRRGLRVGLYASESGYPELGQDWRWIAKWGDVAPRVPCAFWQYSGAGLDRDAFCGADLRAFVLAQGVPAPGNQPPAIPPALSGYNLFPLTAHRLVALAAGTELVTAAGVHYTTLDAPAELGLLFATPGHYAVADGDAAVFVKRDAAGVIRTGDANVGQ